MEKDLLSDFRIAAIPKKIGWNIWHNTQFFSPKASLISGHCGNSRLNRNAFQEIWRRLCQFGPKSTRKMKDPLLSWKHWYLQQSLSWPHIFCKTVNFYNTVVFIEKHLFSKGTFATLENDLYFISYMLFSTLCSHKSRFSWEVLPVNSYPRKHYSWEKIHFLEYLRSILKTGSSQLFCKGIFIIGERNQLFLWYVFLNTF